MGAELVRGRVGKGPSLLGAEMSSNAGCIPVFVVLTFQSKSSYEKLSIFE